MERLEGILFGAVGSFERLSEKVSGTLDVVKGTELLHKM